MDSNIEQLLYLYPAPWKIVDSKSGDHKNNPIPMLCDVALGNTDTSTGPYADP